MKGGKKKAINPVNRLELSKFEENKSDRTESEESSSEEEERRVGVPRENSIKFNSPKPSIFKTPQSSGGKKDKYSINFRRAQHSLLQK